MYASRIDHVRAFLRDDGPDAFLLTAAPDIRWATGFSGSAGVLLVTDSRSTLITDGRYRGQADLEVDVADVEIHTGSAIKHLAESSLLKGIDSIGIDSAQVTVAFFEELESSFRGRSIRPTPSPFRRQIASKDSGEIETLRRAQAITDAVFEELLGILRPGISEIEVAAEIVFRHLDKGAAEMSFPPTVASGENGALPHARPTERLLQQGDLVVLDLGCFLDGYASDMTRTVALGKPPDHAVKAYDVVVSAHSEAQRSARSGMLAGDLDSIGRTVIESAGYGEAFSHGLGHGLGLRLHEWPRVGRNCNYPLPENTVITIEPGIYLPGSFGIRIENAVLLTASGADPLPASDTSLIVI